MPGVGRVDPDATVGFEGDGREGASERGAPRAGDVTTGGPWPLELWDNDGKAGEAGDVYGASCGSGQSYTQPYTQSYSTPYNLIRLGHTLGTPYEVNIETFAG